MSTIHPTAIIAPGAKIAAHVEIGPFCVVGHHVQLDEGVRLVSHVCVEGHTHIGARTVIYPFASIGLPPQDLKYKGENSRLIIGMDNTIREYVTMQPGTEGGAMETRVGDGCLFMAGIHIAHDCQIGSHVIMANYATLAGHVEVGDHAIIGGLVGVHQFARIGHHAIIGGLSPVDGDVIPYASVKGDRAYLNGLNLVGLKRRGFSREEIDMLRKAYRMLFAEEGTLAERLADAAATFEAMPAVMELVDFMRSESKCGLCLPHD
jgi:UDP-N-acetylglucosamine acyltransferase